MRRVSCLREGIAIVRGCGFLESVMQVSANEFGLAWTERHDLD